MELKKQNTESKKKFPPYLVLCVSMCECEVSSIEIEQQIHLKQKKLKKNY